ncbi:hypothetical protein KFE25_004284 [Diacronema lutheri]|uniref:Uncharacterized protein n=2 Tax=Diacronema lutheri TaxID=2081491 RepID=A0A8J5XFJ9_DIALT|nr:hypothetical protein KFE25_004284 [Diacronema lutheri]
MKSSPPLKAKLLFDDAFRPQPSPLVARTEPLLLHDTLSVQVLTTESGASDANAERDAPRELGLRARCAAACDELPTPRDACKGLLAPCRSRTGYVRRMVHNFGLPFVLMLTSCYLLIKGMLVQLISLAKLPFYKQAGVGARAYQQYDIVTKTPWALKALFGALSDLLPLCGYGKQTYMTAVSLVGGISCVALAIVTSGAISSQPSVLFVTLCFLGVNLQAAVVDLLAEGRYTAAMAEAPWSGSDCVSWVWACVQAGSFCAAVLVGWAADSASIHALFPLAAVLALQVVPLSELGALGDVRLPEGQRGFQRAKFDDNPRVFLLAGLMAMAGVLVGACNLFGASTSVLLSASVGCSAGLCTLAFWALPRVLAKCNLYLYLCSVLYVQVSGAVDYFYVAPDECVPGGPHFSFRYYITYSAVVQSLFGYLGVVLFQTCMRRWTFRSVLASTVLLQVMAGAVDLVIVLRWNVLVGIPDEVMYMLGYNVVYQIASMLNFMPSVILTSKLCPPQLEATMFALLAGFQNFGAMVAGSLGVELIAALGIRTGGADADSADVAPAGAGTCDFSRLPHAIVLSHMLLPLLCIPLGYLLLPGARMTDQIRIEDDGVHHVPRAKPAGPPAQQPAGARGAAAGAGRTDAVHPRVATGAAAGAGRTDAVHPRVATGAALAGPGATGQSVGCGARQAGHGGRAGGRGAAAPEREPLLASKRPTRASG